jgi:hypothetical protein
MKVYRLIGTGLILLGTHICRKAEAQVTAPLGEWEWLQQRVYVNPALQPKGRLHVSVPVLGMVYMEHRNNWLQPARDFTPGDDGVVRLDAASMLRHANATAYTGAGAIIELAHVGMRLGDRHYVHVRIAERARASLAIPRDLLILGVYGNTGHNYFEDHTARLNGLRADGIHYREHALGYSILLGKKVQVGLTAKYLYGMERVYTAESSLSLYTHPETYEMRTAGALRVQTAGLYGALSGGESVQSNLGNYLFGLPNRGFAGDVGVVYRPHKRLRLDVAVNDLGYINWRGDVATWYNNDAQFAFRGLDLTDAVLNPDGLFGQEANESLDRFLEELEEVYAFERSHDGFRTGVGAFARAGASYELVHTRMGNGRLWSNFLWGLSAEAMPLRMAAGFNQSLWNKLELGLHISNQYSDGTAVGGGFATLLGPVQLWLCLESIRAVQFTAITIQAPDTGNGSRFICPENASDVRVQLGLNMVFGRKDKERSKAAPMVR